MTKRAHLRSLAIGLLALGLPVSVIAATFQGPATQPPTGNAPGVIWNMKDNPAQTQSGAVINIPGLRNDPATKDIYLENTKAFRVDGVASTTFNFGNFSSGLKPFTASFYGDVIVNDFLPYTSSGTRGRVQASEFCFNPGNPSDCIQDWGSAGGSGFVLKAGDTMTGNLGISSSYSGALGSTSTLSAFASLGLGSTFTEASAGNFIISPPNSSVPAGVVNGVKSMVNSSGASASTWSTTAVRGNSALSSGTTNYNYGGDFIASVNANGTVSTEAAGVHGQFNATTDFASVNRALGVYGEALNLTPTKAPNYLYGVQGYAQGKSGTETTGVYGNTFVNGARTTPQSGVYGIANLFTGGSATNAYGVRGEVTNGGGSATNAYGLRGDVSAGSGAMTNSYGVYGNTTNANATTRYGVYGITSAAGTGVYGNGGTGVQGVGSTNGGVFTGGTYGLTGSASYAGASFTGTTYGMLVNGTGVGVDVTVPNSAGGQRGMYIHMPNKGDGIQIENAGRGMVIGATGLNSTGIQVSATDVAINASTDGTSGPNNYAGWFQSPENSVAIAQKGGSGLKAYSNTANAAGEFYNGTVNKTVYLSGNTYPIEVKSGSSQMFYVNNNGEVHSNGSPYAGYYFHDRQNLANVLWAWYSDGGATPANSTARLYRSGVGDLLTVDSVGNLMIGSGTAGCLKDRDGTILAGTCASDISLKQNIKAWNTDALSVLSNLPIKTYDWKDGGKDQLGVIAQDAQKADQNLVQIGEDGKLKVHFEELPFYTIKAVQQLKAENDELKSKVDNLEQRLQKLEAKIK